MSHRAFDLEKRQHLFANGILKPLKRDQVGIFGMGSVSDAGVDIQAAEDESEKKWSKKKSVMDGGVGSMPSNETLGTGGVLHDDPSAGLRKEF